MSIPSNAAICLSSVVRDRHPRWVVLGTPFKRQEVVVSTPACSREGPAHCRPGFVDCAPALFCVEETADFAKVLIFFAAHRIGDAMIFFGEFGFGLGKRQTMILGEPLNISFGKLDDGIRAAIAGAFEAIVHGA
jgi:hypothetical protein